MKRNSSAGLIGIMFVLSILWIAGCAGTRNSASIGEATTSAIDEETARELRNSGAIATAAGEEVGWAATVEGDEAKRQPFAITEGLLHGQIAGVTVLRRADGTLSVVMRGPSSILGGNEPLFVIDGMPILHMERGVFMNPHDILKIEVLKDADSKALYGARGANGVVLITTKLGPGN